MKIKRILNQNRRDFTAEYVCEHCGDVHTGSGYDDSYFHKEIIPDMKCGKCGKVSPKNYKPKRTKYPDSWVV